MISKLTSALVVILLLMPFVSQGGSSRYLTADGLTSIDRTKTWTPPAASDTLLGRVSTDTITNKTLTCASNHITSTTGRAAQFNASTGDLEASSVTGTELGYVSGVTSAIQTQLNAKQASLPLTSKGDLLTHTGATYVRQAAGSDGAFVMYDASQTNGIRAGALAAGSGVSINRVGATTTIATSGTPAPNAAEVSGDTTLTSTQDFIANISTAAATWTLPDCTTLGAHVFHAYHDSDYPLTLAASGSDKIKYGNNTASGGDSSITIIERGIAIDVVCYGGTVYRVH